MWLPGLLKMRKDLAGHMPVLWVPDSSSPGTVQDGAEQWPKPRACPSLSGRELGWFWLMTAGALYNGADVLGTHSASGAKQHSPSPSILRPVTTTKLIEKQAQILSSTRTNIFMVILRFIKILN